MINCCLFANLRQGLRRSRQFWYRDKQDVYSRSIILESYLPPRLIDRHRIMVFTRFPAIFHRGHSIRRRLLKKIVQRTTPSSSFRN